MGTYTTNKNLFMPTVGETGWGELVNGNFETIDTFLKPISLSGSTYTFTGNHVGNQSGGSISATKGTFSGAVTGATFNDAVITNNAINYHYTRARIMRGEPTNTPIFYSAVVQNNGSYNIATMGTTTLNSTQTYAPLHTDPDVVGCLLNLYDFSTDFTYELVFEFSSAPTSLTFSGAFSRTVTYSTVVSVSIAELKAWSIKPLKIVPTGGGQSRPLVVRLKNKTGSNLRVSFVP